MDTSVYRYYDKHGRLIYVGITSRGSKRNREHNESKDWWQWVARQEVSHYPSREDAAEKETELIQTFKPPFNTAHNAGWREIRDEYEEEMQFPSAAEQHEWSRGYDAAMSRTIADYMNHAWLRSVVDGIVPPGPFGGLRWTNDPLHPRFATGCSE